MARRRWGTAVLVVLAVWALFAAILVVRDITWGWEASAPTGTAPSAALLTGTITPPHTAVRALVSSSSVPDATVTAEPTPSQTSTATATPTCTQSPEPTPTSTPTATPLPTLTPTPFSLNPPVLIKVTPTVSDTTPVPTAVPVADVSPGTINIVLLGSDRRPEWNDWHTDVVQIVSVQPAVPAVTVLSIPRDLYVYIPDFWMSRINFADMYGDLYGYEGGGPALIQQTLLYNLGIPIDHYVRVDFDGFIGIVDILGGVDIPVHCRLEDHWPYPDENGEYPIKVLEPGVYHMDGETALWYARSRKTSSVFARERRQQQVLEAIWRKARTLDVLPRLPQLWDQYRHMVVTDLSLIDTVRLAEVALRLNSQNVRTRSIGYQHVIPWTTPKGGNVFLPDWERIEPLIAEALGPVPETHLWRSFQTVEVWNGTPNTDWGTLASDRLHGAGFGAVVAEPDRRDYAHTRLIDFTTVGSGSAASYLQWLFRVSPENVVTAPDPNISVPYRLIIGADYQTCPGY